MIDIIIAFPRLEDANNIKRLIVKNGYDSVMVCTNAAQVIDMSNKLDGGVVLCGYKLTDMLYLELYRCLPNGFIMVLLASASKIRQNSERGVICVPMPLKINVLIHTIEEVISIQRKLYKKNSKPRPRTKEQQKVIDEAKALLMESQNMSEEDAHRYIQKISMDSGNSMSETAEMILLLK